jgi:hypothetical protein
MAVYSVNQATHLYVVASTPSVKTTKDGGVKIVGLGANKDLATDLIAKNKVLSVSDTSSAKLAPKANKAVVTIAGTDADGNGKIDGGTYVMRVIIDNYFSESPSGSYIKHASAYVKNGAEAAELATKLAESLRLGLKRDIEPAFAVVASGAEITITPIATEFVLGRKATTIPQISVELVPTSELDTEADWGEVKYIPVAPVAEGRDLGAEILADYEYFCLGERGDQYRGIGWPNNIHTEYLVDPKLTYDVIDIHYAYVGSNESVQKSEKDLTIVCPTGTGNDLLTAVNAATGLSLKFK